MYFVQCSKLIAWLIPWGQKIEKKNRLCYFIIKQRKLGIDASLKKKSKSAIILITILSCCTEKHIQTLFKFSVFCLLWLFIIHRVHYKFHVSDVDMNPRDPRWIGAWWLGFLVFGTASLVISTVLLFFPRRLKQSEKDKAKGKKLIRTEEFKGSLKEKIKGEL